MDFAVVTLILCILVGVLAIIIRFVKSDQKKPANSNANAKVYDVTSYVEERPGGDAILAHAGDDSAQGFFGAGFSCIHYDFTVG